MTRFTIRYSQLQGLIPLNMNFCICCAYTTPAWTDNRNAKNPHCGGMRVMGRADMASLVIVHEGCAVGPGTRPFALLVGKFIAFEQDL